VILIDANLLIYAHVSSFAEHQVARDWLDRQLNGSAPVGLPWTSLIGFLRIATNPRVFDRPWPTADGWRQGLGLRANRSGRPLRPIVTQSFSADF